MAHTVVIALRSARPARSAPPGRLALALDTAMAWLEIQD